MSSLFLDAGPLTVDPPEITSHPNDLIGFTPGDNASFTVVADGLRLNYTWFLGNEVLVSSDRITGVNMAVLTITSVRESDVGNYRCVVSNAAGNVTSDIATLSLGK